MFRRQDIRRAVRCSSNSRPGPDGVPYLPWRRLGPLGIDLLFEAGRCLERQDATEHLAALAGDGEDGHHFNVSDLCCLPKKEVGHTPKGVAIFTPAGTRPLSIVNTDNRLLANAFRLRWEPLLDSWIGPAQRSFLPGRSMLANVIEIEHAAMLHSLSHEHSAVVIFDFAAAFPSVSHTLMLEMLRQQPLQDPSAGRFIPKVQD